MRFLVDECIGHSAATWLRDQGHDVFSVYEQARGASDDALIRLAFDESRILITNDKDFGEKVFRERLPHHRIVLMRLDDERATNKILILHRLLSGYADSLADQFAVVTENQIRFAGKVQNSPKP